MSQRRRRAPLPKDWHRTRRVILERDPICQLQTHCIGSPAEEADHLGDREIIPPRTSGGLPGSATDTEQHDKQQKRDYAGTTAANNQEPHSGVAEMGDPAAPHFRTPWGVAPSPWPLSTGRHSSRRYVRVLGS